VDHVLLVLPNPESRLAGSAPTDARKIAQARPVAKPAPTVAWVFVVAHDRWVAAATSTEPIIKCSVGLAAPSCAAAKHPRTVRELDSAQAA